MPAASIEPPCRGRFAPSPTGQLHAGSLLTALVSWLRVRQHDGQWLVRMEDIDPPREVPGSAAAIVRELTRLGLHADAPVCHQSQRGPAYAKALDRLRQAGDAFPCWCSRQDLVPYGGLHRDGHCPHPARTDRPPAWRLRVPDAIITFDDALQGPQRQNLRTSVGDFVLRRADGVWAYQLACVVDDAAMGITEVVRGRDLLDSTARQIHLQHRLGLPTPDYVHLPLVTDAHGRKLSKADADQPLATQPAATVLRQTLARLRLPPAAASAGTEQLLQHALAHFNLSRLAQA